MPESCHASSASLPFIIRLRPRRLTVCPMMPMVHEDVHQRTGEDQQPGQHAKDMRGMLRQQEEPGHNQETAAHNPYRGPPPRLFVLFVIHGIHSVQDTSAEEVVERYEDP